MKRVAVFASLILTFGFGLQSIPASAESGLIACGDTITKDTTLHHDILNCPDNGIVVGADNIILNLNGHSIDGDGALVQNCPSDKFCDGGIVNVGHSGLTVKGGSVTGFGVGVFMQETSKNSLLHLVLDDNHWDGLIAVQSSSLRVVGSSITRNGLEPHFAGLAMFTVSGATIENNRLAGNGDQGLFVSNSSNNNRIVRNTFSGETESGLLVDGSANVVRDNRIAGGGIILTGDDNILEQNYIADPPACDDGCGIGISFEGGARNLIERNIVLRAPVRGIRIDAYASAAVKNVIRGNVVQKTGGDGIGINLDNVGSVSGTLVELNVVTGSGDDGIDLDSASTTLRGNVAARNGDLGIEAVPGVLDAGHNRAFGNGNPLQCTNVRCTRRG